MWAGGHTIQRLLSGALGSSENEDGQEETHVPRIPTVC